jgi:hypothetical protein
VILATLAHKAKPVTQAQLVLKVRRAPLGAKAPKEKRAQQGSPVLKVIQATLATKVPPAAQASPAPQVLVETLVLLANKVQMAHKASQVKWVKQATPATPAILDPLVLPDKKGLMVFLARLDTQVLLERLASPVTKVTQVLLE